MLPASVFSRSPAVPAPTTRARSRRRSSHPTDERILQQLAKGLWNPDSMERSSMTSGYARALASVARRSTATARTVAAGWVVKVGRRSGARRTNSLYRAMIPQPVAPAAPPAPEPVELMDAIVVQLADVRAQMDVCHAAIRARRCLAGRMVLGRSARLLPRAPGRGARRARRVRRRPGSPGRGKLLAKLKAVYDDVARRQPPDWLPARTGLPNSPRSARMRSGTAWTLRRLLPGGATPSRSSAVSERTTMRTTSSKRFGASSPARSVCRSR